MEYTKNFQALLKCTVLYKGCMFVYIPHRICSTLRSEVTVKLISVKLKKLCCIDVDYYFNLRNMFELSVLSLVSCSCWVNYFVNKCDPLLS